MKILLPALLLLADAGEASKGFDPASCGLIRTLAPLGGELYGAVFSPDGTRLAVGCGQGVRLYETAGWKEAGRLEGHAQHVYSTAFSRDGKTLAAGGFEGMIQVWDVESGRPLRSLAGPSTYVSALAFSPDGRRLLSGGLDGSLRVWDLAEAGRAKEPAARPGAVTDVVFHADRALTAGTDGRVHVWRTDTWELERTVDLTPGVQVRWLAFSPGGRRVAALTADGLAGMEAEGGRAATRLPLALEASICRPMPDGRHVVVAAAPRKVKIIDLLRGPAAELLHHAGEVTSIAVHPSGRLFATTGQERHLKIWGRVAGGMAHVKPRGFLGVRIQQDAAGGVYLAEVIPGTPAEGAGLRGGDLLRRVGGKAVANPTEATDQIGSFLEGDEVELLIGRDGGEKTLRVRLGRRPPALEP